MAPTEDRPPAAPAGQTARPNDPVALPDRLEAVVHGFDRLRDRPVASTVVAVVLVAAGAVAWWSGRPGPVEPVEARIPFAATADSLTTVVEGGDAPADASGNAPADASDDPVELLVHVAGAVRRPGIVRLDPGARIGDAVDAAGGPTAAADLHQLNLAAPVVDGLQVRVPEAGEVVPATGVAPQIGGTATGSAPLVDVNRATEAELEALPGIGPALAAAIVEWRSANGPFGTVDDLADVPGIGPAKLDGLIDHVTL